jgi:hypothetical protein
VTTQLIRLASIMALAWVLPGVGRAQELPDAPHDPVIIGTTATGVSTSSPIEWAMTESDTPASRSPFTAGMLSLLIPGVGQFYNGQLVKGGVHFALGAAAAWMTVQGFASEACQGWSYRYWDAFEQRYRERWIEGEDCGWGYAGAGISAGMRIWSVIDAASGARRFNARAGGMTVSVAPLGGKPAGAVVSLRF